MSPRSSWHSDGGIRRPVATAGATNGGSTAARSSPRPSSPDVVPQPMSDAAGVDPEEALVASVASCHMLWFLSLAQEAGVDVASYSDSAEGRDGADRSGPAGAHPDHAPAENLIRRNAAVGRGGRAAPSRGA